MIHVVVLHIGQLIGALVEGNRQTACRIVVAEQDIGHSQTTGLTAVPCLQQCLILVLYSTKADGRT